MVSISKKVVTLPRQESSCSCCGKFLWHQANHGPFLRMSIMETLVCQTRSGLRSIDFGQHPSFHSVDSSDQKVHLKFIKRSLYIRSLAGIRYN